MGISTHYTSNSTTALLYILENIVKDTKKSPIELVNDMCININAKRTIENNNTNYEYVDIDLMLKRQKVIVTIDKLDYMIDANSTEDCRVVMCDLRPILNLNICYRNRSILPQKDTNADLQALEMFNADGHLTIYGLVKLMSNNICTYSHKFSLKELEVMHNLRTKEFIQFSRNLLNHLMPENMHSDRSFFSPTELSYSKQDMTIKFFRYFNSLTNVTAAASRDSRSFNTVNRPHLKDIIYERPSNMSRDYFIQPRYAGYRVVINTTERVTRVYNIHCEYIQSLLIHELFNRHSTFEAILLPNSNNEPKSWRYCGQKSHKVHTKDYYFIVVVDVLRYRNELLIDKPFELRAKYISRIKGTNVIHAETICPESGQDSWTQLYKRYKNSNSQFYPIDGIVLRHKKSTAAKAPYQYRFPKHLLFNINTLTNQCLEGNIVV